MDGELVAGLATAAGAVVAGVAVGVAKLRRPAGEVASRELPLPPPAPDPRDALSLALGRIAALEAELGELRQQLARVQDQRVAEQAAAVREVLSAVHAMTSALERQAERMDRLLDGLGDVAALIRSQQGARR